MIVFWMWVISFSLIGGLVLSFVGMFCVDVFICVVLFVVVGWVVVVFLFCCKWVVVLLVVCLIFGVLLDCEIELIILDFYLLLVMVGFF